LKLFKLISQLPPPTHLHTHLKHSQLAVDGSTDNVLGDALEDWQCFLEVTACVPHLVCQPGQVWLLRVLLGGIVMRGII